MELFAAGAAEATVRAHVDGRVKEFTRGREFVLLVLEKGRSGVMAERVGVRGRVGRRGKEGGAVSSRSTR